MKLSELLKHVPHVRFEKNEDEIDYDITTVRDIDADGDDTQFLFWVSRANIHRAAEHTRGTIIMPPDPEVSMYSYPELSIIYCEDPKASIITALNVLYPANEYSAWLRSTGAMPTNRVEYWKEHNTVVMNTHVDGSLRLGCNTTIGGEGFGYHKGIRFPHIGNVIIGDNVEVGSNTCIDRGAIGDTIIGEGVKIDNLVHIAHNVRIGERCIIPAGVIIGGSAIIGNDVQFGIGALIRNKVRIGDGATIGMGAVVTKDVPAGETWVGNPARKMEKT